MPAICFTQKSHDLRCADPFRGRAPQWLIAHHVSPMQARVPFM
jgi:hypothetical protein